MAARTGPVERKVKGVVGLFANDVDAHRRADDDRVLDLGGAVPIEPDEHVGAQHEVAPLPALEQAAAQLLQIAFFRLARHSSSSAAPNFVERNKCASLRK